MHVESLRGSCRTGWHQESSADGFSWDQKQGLLVPSRRSFSKSPVEAAKHCAELPLVFQLVSPANPYSGSVHAPTLPI